GHTHHIRSLAVSKDGKKALSGAMDRTARLWDLDTGKELVQFKFPGDHSWVWSVAFSPDEKSALSSGSLDSALRLWDLETGKEVRKFEGHTGRAYGAAFSPDGKHVASSGAEADSSVRIWDADTGKELHKLDGHTGYVWRVAYSPDGKKLASVGC